MNPFSGSGTSALVEAHYGVGLGIELSSEYAQLSVKRCEDAGMKADLFYSDEAKE
ncbi:hypothetical protein [Sporosarcina sp.]|uniref:hypothetical protein n=1 Tax=Sporosarcina sp. TaxID=49982 RepID=UPI002624DE7A|nr:hypothetical protein [Sporosarcina sp.]